MRRVLLLAVLGVILTGVSHGQEPDESLGRNLWHGTKLVSRLIVRNSSVRVGQNVGASGPIGIPEGVGVLSYSPRFSPVLALETDFFFWNRFIVNVGVQMEYKGMRTRSRVRDFYTEVVQESGGGLLRVAGWFTGYNVTDVNINYATLPVRLGVWVSPYVALKLGLYYSFALSKHFNGYVEEGYLWSVPHAETGESTKVLVEYADFDFSKHIRGWDWGGELSASVFISSRFYVDAGISMGARTLMHSDFSAMPFRMYNVYATLGLGYRFMGMPTASR